ncbi:Protein SHQ1 like protein [Myotis davidii]|uniref:Protein SHQ1 homolog n=1 Tax=Myotis davidii TaxID=225400 RepID=L5MLI5_MYODS|nr:Protein SHQ1 like protein [Myotis davidii]
MLTPAFDLSQDPDFLTVAIRVPHARVSEFDVYFQGVDFKFYAKPYFLRQEGYWLGKCIVAPGNIGINGIFTIQLPKETPGQHFEGLNMLTTLLAPRKSRTAKPLVEEIGASGVSEEGVEDDDEDFDWEIEQSPYEEVSESALHPQSHYGFGGLRSGVFQRLQEAREASATAAVLASREPGFWLSPTCESALTTRATAFDLASDKAGTAVDIQVLLGISCIDLQHPEQSVAQRRPSCTTSGTLLGEEEDRSDLCPRGIFCGEIDCDHDEFSDVIDIKDPDFTPAAERRQKRLAAEVAKFDPDHYLPWSPDCRQPRYHHRCSHVLTALAPLAPADGTEQLGLVPTVVQSRTGAVSG